MNLINFCHFQGNAFIEWRFAILRSLSLSRNYVLFFVAEVNNCEIKLNFSDIKADYQLLKPAQIFGYEHKVSEKHRE